MSPATGDEPRDETCNSFRDLKRLMQRAYRRASLGPQFRPRGKWLKESRTWANRIYQVNEHCK